MLGFVFHYNFIGLKMPYPFTTLILENLLKVLPLKDSLPAKS